MAYQRLSIIGAGSWGLALAGAAHIADVVHQQRAGVVQPVLRLQRFGQQPAADDLLAHQGHHHGVLDVVVQRGGVADALQHQARRAAHIGGVFRPPVGEVLEIDLRQVVTQARGHHGCRVEHGAAPPLPSLRPHYRAVAARR